MKEYEKEGIVMLFIAVLCFISQQNEEILAVWIIKGCLFCGFFVYGSRKILTPATKDD